MYQYDIYKDGELLATDLYRKELIEFIGTSNNVIDYHHDKLICEDDLMDIKGYQVQRHKEKKDDEKTITDLIDDWDRMTVAAELLRTGQGYIKTVIVNGEHRRVTVPR